MSWRQRRHLAEYSSQMCGAATAKARLPTVDSFTGGTTSLPVGIRRTECSSTKQVVDTSQLLLLLHPFTGLFSKTTGVSRYQKGKTSLDFTGARDSEWQWHQLGHMQICTSLQTDNHANTPPLSFFTGRVPFLPPNQQRQSTEGLNDTDNTSITDTSV